MIRPIPHHVHQQHHQQQVPQLQVNYSPVNVTRFSQSPVSEVKLGIVYYITLQVAFNLTKVSLRILPQ